MIARRSGLIVFFIGLLPLSLFAAEPPPQLTQGGFTSARVCAGCHVAIHQGWQGSMHANAVNDPIFYPIFLEASRQTGGKSDRLCLSCHAPTTRFTQDWGLKNPLSREGVTCDFCHSVKEVKADAANTLVVEPGRTKWGPLRDVTSPFHGTAYAPVFQESRFCGSCHEFVNERGVTILGTYTEWRDSPQAKEGKNCQSCHMPPVEGKIVAPSVKPTPEIYIHSHEAAGGHYASMVKKAVTVRLGKVTRAGDKVTAIVLLENVGSGHKMPTGLPTRKLVLNLRATLNGTPMYSEDRVFQKVLVNQKGEVITKDTDVFLEANAVREDNRLEPKKPREEYFTFIAPEGKPIQLEVRLYYLYQPRLIQETEMKIDLGAGKLEVPAQ